MYRIDIFSRDKNGNRGKLITSSYYPTEQKALKAKDSIKYLSLNQRKFGAVWILKNIIVDKPVLDRKYDCVK